MIRKSAWVISIVNVIANFIVLMNYPNEIIPIHFNIAGEADRWGSKWFYLIIAFIPLVLMIIFELYKYFTMKNEKSQKNKKLQDKIIPPITFLFVVLNWIFLAPILNEANSIEKMMFYILIPFGLLFIFLGNFMGKIQQNHFLGIRVKWTLTNEVVWKKTHRLAGVLYVISGIITIIWSFICKIYTLQIPLLIVFFSLVLVSNLIPIIYSYKLYKKVTK